jgi:predicted TIM-barrel fold metal-dependent hydrolase
VVGEVAVVELLATEYPEVAFIIPHLGSFADDWRAQSALIDHLVRHPNVYADTSGVRRFDILQQAVQRAGARKFIFGSDGP